MTGNGHGNGRPEHEHGEAPDALAQMSSLMLGLREALDRKLSALNKSTREALAENVEVFRGLMSMTEDAAADYAAQRQKLDDRVLDQLTKQAQEIATLQRRISVLERLRDEAPREVRDEHR